MFCNTCAAEYPKRILHASSQLNALWPTMTNLCTLLLRRNFRNVVCYFNSILPKRVHSLRILLMISKQNDDRFFLRFVMVYVTVYSDLRKVNPTNPHDSSLKGYVGRYVILKYYNVPTERISNEIISNIKIVSKNIELINLSQTCPIP